MALTLVSWVATQEEIAEVSGTKICQTGYNGK